MCGELAMNWAIKQSRARIIPACAGNSSTTARTRSRTSDHPRVCGELPVVRQLTLQTTGSSPRVRGTRAATGRAGPSAADHPRVCGELAWQIEQFDRATGSSPRVRGTPRRRRGLHPPRRIIPACAGNSVRFAARQGLSADHPRVCGELLGSSITYAGRGGSSPRVRGTPGVQYHIRG